MNVGDTLTLTIESLAFGGDRIAHAPDGRVVFVDGGAPGDVVQARVEAHKARFARARLISVRAPGDAHTDPPCPLVERCGGCPWQSVTLSAQRAAKFAIVERALRRVAPEVDVRPLVSPTGGFHYRSRARMTAGEAPRGDRGSERASDLPAAPPLGFQARRSHEVVDVASCMVLEPGLDRAFALARAALAGALPPGGTVAGLVGRGGDVQLAITGLAPESSGPAGSRMTTHLSTGPRATGEGDAARARLRALVGGTVDPRIVSVIIDGEAHGAATIDIGADGEAAFLAAADGFAQATHEGSRALRRVVREELCPASAEGQAATLGRVLELYAGDGNFTRDLIRIAGAVVAVEGDRQAAARLGVNLAAACPRGANVFEGPRVHAEPAEVLAARLFAAGERFDAVLLDPPRAGAPGLAPLLAALAPRIVYVSCDPMTLARDAAALVAEGLLLVRATPVDLMPQSFHVETVCVFERR